MEKCEIFDCPSFNEKCSSNCNSEINVEKCDVRLMLLDDKNFDIPTNSKKCDNCNAIFPINEGSRFTTMNAHSKDLQNIELCNECAKEIMG